MPVYYTEIFLLAFAMVLLMAEAFVPKITTKQIGLSAIAGLIGCFAMLFFVQAPDLSSTSHPFWSFYSADRLAIFYKGLAILCTIFVLVIALDYLPILKGYLSRSDEAPCAEFFIMPLFICTGMMWLASSIDLSSIFLSLELVTISFYIMVSYMRRNVGSLESGVKYLILGALSTGFFVYGVAWLYGLTGETNLSAIQSSIQNIGQGGQERALLFAFALLMVGLGFKVAAAPFHIWVPDVYQGAPTPISAYLSVGSKAAGFVILCRIVEPFLFAPGIQNKVILFLTIIAAVTLIIGNLGALGQSNFKRLLAYSSIAHAGFLLTALACSFPEKLQIPSASAIAFYLACYAPMTLSCFLILSILRRSSGSEEVSILAGLHQRSPFLAAMLLIAAAGLAGIPPLAGFFGKFYVFNLAVDQGQWFLLAVAIIGAAIALYYYFNLIREAYWQDPSSPATSIEIPMLSKVALILLCAATILIGFSPVKRLLNQPTETIEDVGSGIKRGFAQ